MGFNTSGDSGSSILQAGARLFWLSMISLVITLPRRRYGMGAISVYSGFKSTDLYTVPGSPWTVNSTTGAFCLAYPTDVYNSSYTTSVTKRSLYPQCPQIRYPTGEIRYFSLSFDCQMRINSTFSAQSGTESYFNLQSNFNWLTNFEWSFSNEGEAPRSTQRDTPTSPGTSPPPPATVPDPSPPPNLSPPDPRPFCPAPPVLPPFCPAPKGPATPIKSPPEPPPPGSPRPDPPSPTTSSVQLKLKISFGVVGGIIFGLCCWKIYRIFFYPIIFFLAHASGDDHNSTTKSFTEWLSNDMKMTWRYKFHLIRVFFDKNSLPMGLPFPEGIHLALSQTRVGVVIVTKDFFEGKWPMNELLSLVKSSETNSRKVRILPLFYTINVKDVRTKLNDRDWDEKWRQMSTPEHPIDVEECRKAVGALCNAYGVDYPFRTHSYDADYIKLALKAVCKTYNQMLLWS